MCGQAQLKSVFVGGQWFDMQLHSKGLTVNLLVSGSIPGLREKVSTVFNKTDLPNKG